MSRLAGAVAGAVAVSAVTSTAVVVVLVVGEAVATVRRSRAAGRLVVEVEQFLQEAAL